MCLVGFGGGVVKFCRFFVLLWFSCFFLLILEHYRALKWFCWGAPVWERKSTLGRGLASTTYWAQSRGGSLCGRRTDISSGRRFHLLDQNACPSGEHATLPSTPGVILNAVLERKKINKKETYEN